MGREGLTRRRFVGGAVGAGSAVLAGRPGVAVGAVGRASHGSQVSELRLGRLVGSRVFEVGSFDLVGASWAGSRSRLGRAARVWLRVRRAGVWSPWFDASSRGHEPDGAVAGSGGGSRTVGEPVWAGGADAVEVRSDAELEDVRLHFVVARLPGLAESAQSTYVTPAYAAGGGQPNIIARRVWANAACRPRRRAGVGDVRLGFVHHTENANSYSRSESAAMVQAICLFHRNVRGWDDIGYNFLLDRYGQIFEGRAGGIDQPVVGAQAGGYNLVSTGVGVLGNFMAAAPTAKAMAALEQLLAWKLSLHGVPAVGDIDVVVNKAGAVYSKYPAGAHVTLKRISGHRDADSTDCPGNVMYGRLPGLRDRVDLLAGTIGMLTINGPLNPPVTAPATVGGVLGLREGAPIAGASLEIQVHDRARVRTVATVQTASDGSWSAVVAAPHVLLVRALFAGDAAHPAVVSPYFNVAFAPVVTLTVGTPGVTPVAGQPVSVAGAVVPAKKVVRVELLAADGLGGFTRAALVKLRAAPGGAFSGAVTPPTSGSYRLVARTDADKLNGVGTSAPVDVVVG